MVESIALCDFTAVLNFVIARLLPDDFIAALHVLK
jgi:hypothetical protein